MAVDMYFLLSLDSELVAKGMLTRTQLISTNCCGAIHAWTGLIALLSLFVTFRFRKVNSVFLIIGSATLGYILQLL